jgi:hypothetical protein
MSTDLLAWSTGETQDEAPPCSWRGHCFPAETAPLPARWPLVAIPDPPVPLERCLVGLAVVFRDLGRCLGRLRLRRGRSGLLRSFRGRMGLVAGAVGPLARRCGRRQPPG